MHIVEPPGLIWVQGAVGVTHWPSMRNVPSGHDIPPSVAAFAGEPGPFDEQATQARAVPRR